jgi:nucleotide-binding universal stress UspA family protein
MSKPFSGYERILAATDFSEWGDKALQRAVWLAQISQSPLVVAHVVADLRKAVHQTSYHSRLEFLEGHEEHFQRELRLGSDAKLKRAIASLGATGIEIRYETLLGEPHVELIHSVQQEKYDLVVVGTRGHSAIQKLILGSTAKRLVRKCPTSVWVAKQQPKPPACIVAAVDMSQVSRRAFREAVWVAQRSGASLHVLHAVEATGIPAELLDTELAGRASHSLRQTIEAEVKQAFEKFVEETSHDGITLESHLRWGSPAHETLALADRLKADLIVMGTVGRTGVQGLLLGNTAESVLVHSNCDVLTVKPADFVSPIQPASWELHPGPEKHAT